MKEATMHTPMTTAMIVCAMLVLSPAFGWGQFLPPRQADGPASGDLSGNLRSDLFSGVDSWGARDSLSVGEPVEKSPLRAALYSAVIPGAGDVYAESYWTAAAFFTAEVGLWVLHFTYENKGDNQTAAFEAFADQHWQVDKYALWMEQYALSLNPNATGCSGLVVNPTAEHPWDRVDWTRLNMCEESIGEVASTGFSHRLPRRPDQQYYEMIGKYEQYNPGWDDANVTAADYLTNVSDNFRAYRDMRGDANDFYTTARTASYLLVANHILAALHSAWRAARFNHDLTMKAHLEPVQRQGGRVEYVPTATFSLTL
jgi:hypothetical protein